MPAPKYTVRRRYFTERDLHGDPLPDERLLYLELLEIDEEAGVARFQYDVAGHDLEVWKATVVGWESRGDVRERIRAETVASWIEGGVLTIPLTSEPRVTQIEIRRADLSTSLLYRVTTQGKDTRTFRYRTERDTSEAVAASRWWMRVEETRPRLAIVDEGGRPVFTDEGGADEYGVVLENGRPVLDSDAPTGAYVATVERAAVRLVDDYEDEASGFVRPVAYTEPPPDEVEPFDDGGRPAYEPGTAGDTWRQARANVVAGAGLAVYRSEIDG